MTYDEEIALLFDDIRRYSNNDGRIDECLVQAMKLIQSEVDALAFEAAELGAALTFEKARQHPWNHRNEGRTA